MVQPYTKKTFEIFISILLGRRKIRKFGKIPKILKDTRSQNFRTYALHESYRAESPQNSFLGRRYGRSIVANFSPNVPKLLPLDQRLVFSESLRRGLQVMKVRRWRSKQDPKISRRRSKVGLIGSVIVRSSESNFNTSAKVQARCRAVLVGYLLLRIV